MFIFITNTNNLKLYFYQPAVSRVADKPVSDLERYILCTILLHEFYCIVCHYLVKAGLVIGPPRPFARPFARPFFSLLVRPQHF